VKKRSRLRSRREVQRVLQSRRIFSSAALIAYARPGPDGLRLAVAVSRRVRGAVGRNRVRRRLRESARAGLLQGDSTGPDLGMGYDVVVIGRPPALEAGFEVLVAEMAAIRRRLGRLEGR
jgi:ribonuclease P protein component